MTKAMRCGPSKSLEWMSLSVNGCESGCDLSAKGGEPTPRDIPVSLCRGSVVLFGKNPRPTRCQSRLTARPGDTLPDTIFAKTLPTRQRSSSTMRPTPEASAPQSQDANTSPLIPHTTVGGHDHVTGRLGATGPAPDLEHQPGKTRAPAAARGGQRHRPCLTDKPSPTRAIPHEHHGPVHHRHPSGTRHVRTSVTAPCRADWPSCPPVVCVVR
jgi:hypothetical protein